MRLFLCLLTLVTLSCYPTRRFVASFPLEQPLETACIERELAAHKRLEDVERTEDENDAVVARVVREAQDAKRDPARLAVVQTVAEDGLRTLEVIVWVVTTQNTESYFERLQALAGAVGEGLRKACTAE